MSWKEYWQEARDLFAYQYKSFLTSAGVLLTIYIMSVAIPPGWITGLLSIPPAIVVLLTCIARLNDMGPERNSFTDHARRIGLSLLGASVVLIVAAVFAPPYVMPWRGVMLVWGLGLVFLTTPALPPWPYYISGKYREAKNFRDHLGWFTGSVSRKTGQLSVSELEEAIQRSKEDNAEENQKWHRRGDGDGP